MLKKTHVIAATLSIGLSAVLTSCSSDNGSSTGSTRGQVPARLGTIEAAAEDIIDLVPKRDWHDITRDVRDVEAAWSRYRRRAVADGARTSIVRRLGQALTRLHLAAAAANGRDTAQAANDLSAATVELYGLYDTNRPVDIGRLDVIGRQVILDTQRGDNLGAGTQVGMVASIWNGGLRESVLTHRGKTVAARTDRVLTAMRTAVARGDSRALVTQAKVFLEVVDQMERLY